MNNKLRIFFRNTTYSVLANLIYLFTGIFVILLVPKFFGVVEYGYFQLFLFFTSYAGFFHFGWGDGLILRYAGRQWGQLDGALFSGQIWLFIIFEFAIWLVICAIAIIFFNDLSGAFLVVSVCVSSFLFLVSLFLRFLLQSTNRIKEYSYLMIVERGIYLLLSIGIISFGLSDYRWLVLALIVGQAASLLMAVTYCWDIMVRTPAPFCFILPDVKESLRVGSKLMVANTAAMLIIGVLRFGIERRWGIETFGKVSLLLSILTFILVVVRAVSTVLLPALKNETKHNLEQLYFPLRCIFSWILLSLFILAWPLAFFISKWLPDYSDIIKYIPFVLPICLFESVTNLVILTYMKVFRMEWDILKGNIVALMSSLLFLFLAIFVFNSVSFAILSMPVALSIRVFYLERKLVSGLNIRKYPMLITEAFLCMAFLVLTCDGLFFDNFIEYSALIFFVLLISIRFYLKDLVRENFLPFVFK